MTGNYFVWTSRGSVEERQGVSLESRGKRFPGALKLQLTCECCEILIRRLCSLVVLGRVRQHRLSIFSC